MITYLKSLIKKTKAIHHAQHINYTEDYNEAAKRRNLQMDFYTTILAYCKNSKDENLNLFYATSKITKDSKAEYVTRIKDLVLLSYAERRMLDITFEEYYNFRLLTNGFFKLNEPIGLEETTELRSILNDCIRWLRADPIGTVYAW